MSTTNPSDADTASPPPTRPTITLPPRPFVEAFFAGAASPGPMTLVSSF
ncbi:WRKY transcription factor, partial [Trifolium medium]|nr:WRKY transcription factor [Trifolium medium]